MPAPAPAIDRTAECHDGALRDVAEALTTAAVMIEAHRRELLRYEPAAQSVLVDAALYVIELAAADLRKRRADALIRCTHKPDSHSSAEPSALARSQRYG
jgi:hypothetical protein